MGTMFNRATSISRTGIIGRREDPQGEDPTFVSTRVTVSLIGSLLAGFLSWDGTTIVIVPFASPTAQEITGSHPFG